MIGVFTSDVLGIPPFWRLSLQCDVCFYFIVSLSTYHHFTTEKRENVSSTSGIRGRCLRVTKKSVRGPREFMSG